jgi:hypothetical protein
MAYSHARLCCRPCKGSQAVTSGLGRRPRWLVKAGRDLRLGVNGARRSGELAAEVTATPVEGSGVRGARRCRHRRTQGSVGTLQSQYGRNWVEAFVETYLRYRRLCDFGEHCALQSLAPDMQRSEGHIQAAFEVALGQVSADDKLKLAYRRPRGLAGGCRYSCLEERVKTAFDMGADRVR